MIFIAEAFFSGCISKAINDSKDYSWTKIKKVINDKNNRNLSTKIYRVIEKTLNIVTDKKFKGTDDLYEAIERIFIEFRGNGSTIESVKCGLGMLNSKVSTERCENFLEKFYEGIRQDDDLYKAISLILKEKGIQINQEGFKQIDEKIDNLTAIICNRNDKKIDLQNSETVKSRTQEYFDKWNANMFLNDFDEWDEDAGANVKLREVYSEEYLPHFIWKQNNKESDKLKELLSEYVNEYEGKKMLLILGQPGIGKSTLLTWITANFTDRRDSILIYQFASDLNNIAWNGIHNNDDIADIILKELNLSYDILNGKTLIIDGFDEISIESDRAEILNRFYWQLIKRSMSNNFSLIITCRENYITMGHNLSCAYITLQPWDDKQIQSFCIKYSQKINYQISTITITNILNNQEILGIPLILYMVLALKISIEKEGSIVDVYDQIFSLEWGIYDRCMGYAEPHRIKVIKVQIHEISKRIAFWMFENNPERASITQNEYKKICDNIMKEQISDSNSIEKDVKIGNFFKSVKHCEGVKAEELYFVHRSIYEYFVAEMIYTSICEQLDNSKERLASVFGKSLKKGKLSRNILDYLKQKIVKSKLKNSFTVVNEAFQLMLQDGMIYHTCEHYKNIIDCEMNVFTNMLELIHLWDEGCSLRLDDFFCRYLIYNECFGLNLKGVIFRLGKDESKINMLDLTKSVSISRVNLSGADLRDADLEGADLNRSDLSRAKFQFAKLVSANLSKAVLKNASLIGADLRCANLEDADLTDAELDQSEWYASDVKKIFSQLESAKFTYIVVADCKKKKLYKNELFPDINSPSDRGSRFLLNNELRQNLEEAGIDLLDFATMDDDEKMKALREVGLD